jgi:DNA-binding HxlR family transcriptional regulator
MPLRSDWSNATCPIARSLDVVGDAWTLLILREAFLGLTRYEQFRDRLQIADNVLSRRLSSMVENDLLKKSPYRGEQRTHDEYHLTEAGAELLPVLSALGRWGSRHTPTPPDGGKTRLVHNACGRAARSVDYCTFCQTPLDSTNVSWQRTWLGDELTPLAGPVD